MLAYDVERAQKRFMPASTFKVPHALFALDAGAVRDEFQVIRWDGVKRDFDGWNQDQTLRSSAGHSTVWVYQQFAREIGEVREKEYLTRIQYGNADPSGECRSLLARRRPPDFSHGTGGFPAKTVSKRASVQVEHQRLVKDIMIVEAGRDWILRAKDRMAGACRTADRLVGRLGRDADRGGHLRAEHRSAGRHEGCAETEGDCPIDTPVDPEHFR